MAGECRKKIDIAVRVSYPEQGEYDWFEALAEYAQVGAIEVAFRQSQLFLAKVKLSEVLAPFAKLPIKASSVHMAHAKITKPGTFVSVLEKTIRIASSLGCRLIVVHPSYGSLKGGLQEVNAFFAQSIDPLLEAGNIILCWETFAGKRRFLSGIEGIAAFCEGRRWHRACYDTSHLHKPQEEVISDIKTYADVIKVFHLSNRGDEAGQHLPLRHPGGELDFEGILEVIADSGFSGPITLEYLKEFHEHLVEDALWVMEQLGSS